MKQERLIREAVQAARTRGITVTRGAMFDWTRPGPDGIPVRAEVPTSCDATGAVLLMMGQVVGPGWLKAICAYMDADSFWFWRFWMGWNRNYQVQVWVGDDKGHWEDDAVSHMGRRLARELVG